MKRRDTTVCFDGCTYLSVLRSSESAVGHTASGSTVCGVAPLCDRDHLAVTSVYCTEIMHVLQLLHVAFFNLHVCLLHRNHACPSVIACRPAHKSCMSISYCKSSYAIYTSVYCTEIMHVLQLLQIVLRNIHVCLLHRNHACPSVKSHCRTYTSEYCTKIMSILQLLPVVLCNLHVCITHRNHACPTVIASRFEIMHVPQLTPILA